MPGNRVRSNFFHNGCYGPYVSGSTEQVKRCQCCLSQSAHSGVFSETCLVTADPISHTILYLRLFMPLVFVTPLAGRAVRG